MSLSNEAQNPSGVTSESPLNRAGTASATPRPWRTLYAGSAIVSNDGLVADLTASEQLTTTDEANGILIVRAVNLRLSITA